MINDPIMHGLAWAIGIVSLGLTIAFTSVVIMAAMRLFGIDGGD